jgi:hypothetical protein
LFRHGEDKRPLHLRLRAFLLGLAGVFRTVARFGEIGIRILDSRVLIAVPELAAEGSVPRILLILLFDCTFSLVLVSVLGHR